MSAAAFAVLLGSLVFIAGVAGAMSWLYFDQVGHNRRLSRDLKTERRERTTAQKEVRLLAQELHAIGRQGLTQQDRDGIRKLRSPLLTVEDITGDADV